MTSNGDPHIRFGCGCAGIAGFKRSPWLSSALGGNIWRFASGWTSAALCGYVRAIDMRIELDREEDGRWLTEIPELPGVMAYGQTRDEALARVKALALRVMADRLEHGEAIPELVDVFSVAA
jgi:predicted RNase H-like HicB family nuclease